LLEAETAEQRPAFAHGGAQRPPSGRCLADLPIKFQDHFLEIPVHWLGTAD
jgi:hypothetical protein